MGLDVKIKLSRHLFLLTFKFLSECRLGAYVKGSDAAVDQAFEKKPHLDLFLRQQVGELTECSKSVAFMQALVAS